MKKMTSKNSKIVSTFSSDSGRRRSKRFQVSEGHETEKLDHTPDIIDEFDIIDFSELESSGGLPRPTTPKLTEKEMNVVLGRKLHIENPILPYQIRQPYSSFSTTKKSSRNSQGKNEDTKDSNTAQTSNINFLNGRRRRSVDDWQAKASSLPTSTPLMSLSPPQKSGSPSEVDPVVKEVLMAVYGDDWERYLLKKSSTDVKKPAKCLSLERATDSKQLRAPRVVNDPPLDQKARRKICYDSPQGRGTSLKSPIKIGKEINGISSTSKIVRKRKRDESDSAFNTPTSRRKPPRLSVSETPAGSSVKPTPPTSSMMTPSRTFLASLSVSTPSSIVHPEARDYKVNFCKKKDELVARLYKLFNSEVFDNKLAPNMHIKWNPKMRRTSGNCRSIRRRTRTGEVIRRAQIDLSPLVVDRTDRLRDTLIHEMCHAATWVIDGALDGHGSIWMSWGDKARQRFPELPPLKIGHSYAIATKYTYRCTKCSYSINRQSKSINLDRKRCGRCRGVFELLLNKKKKGETEAPEYETTRNLRAPNKFALFVKEHYKSVKEANVGKRHADIMKNISQQYALIEKAKPPGGPGNSRN